MLRRSPLRRTGRVGRRARERVRAGGKLAVGRPSETLAGWRAVVARVLERAAGRCEWSGVRRAVEIHHVRKRSRGGADHEDNLVALTRTAHALTDAPYRNGRLLIEPLGGGRFCFRLVIADHKGAPLAIRQHEHSPTPGWLAAQGRSPWPLPELFGCSTPQ